MFLVNDSPERRAKRIRQWVHTDPSIALVIAAIYFEWTMSRTLLLLSTRPNTEIRAVLEEIHGLKAYKKFWWKELQQLPDALRLPDVVKDWKPVNDAFATRHKLAHRRDRITRNMATPKVEVLLAAVEDVTAYAVRHGANINRRLTVRKVRKEK